MLVVTGVAGEPQHTEDDERKEKEKKWKKQQRAGVTLSLVGTLPESADGEGGGLLVVGTLPKKGVCVCLHSVVMNHCAAPIIP